MCKYLLSFYLVQRYDVKASKLMMVDHSFDHQSTWSLQFLEGKEKVIGSGLKWLEVLESYHFFSSQARRKGYFSEIRTHYIAQSTAYRWPRGSVFRRWSEGLSVWTFPTSALGDRVQHLCHGIEEWSIQVGWQLEASIAKGPKDGNFGRESSTCSRFPCFSFWEKVKYLPDVYLDFKTSSSNKKKGCIWLQLEWTYQSAWFNPSRHLLSDQQPRVQSLKSWCWPVNDPAMLASMPWSKWWHQPLQQNQRRSSSTVDMWNHDIDTSCIVSVQNVDLYLYTIYTLDMYSSNNQYQIITIYVYMYIYSYVNVDLLN